MQAKLVLENGKEFYGLNITSNKTTVGELVFNTSMVGYQDILSDPAYYKKIVCMSYPLIGNYGLADEDYDAKNIFLSGYIVKEYNDLPSNFRSTRPLHEVLYDHNVALLADIDTREIVKIIRDNGTMKAMICDANKPLQECLAELKNYREETDILNKVSCKKAWYSRTTNPKATLLIVDCGVKSTFARSLNDDGFNVVVVPYNISKEQLLKYKPDAVIISNGPGNPNNYLQVIELIKDLKGNIPLLGVGLGSLLIAKAYDVIVNKMKCGHQGVNLPIKNIITDKIEISNQNHWYSIAKDSIANSKLTVSHIQVIDNDIEGFVCEEDKVIGVLFNPQYNKQTDEYIYKRLYDMIAKEGK